MSRLGKIPTAIPAGVEVTLTDGVLTVKGPKGTLTQKVHKLVDVKIEGSEVVVKPSKETIEARTQWGTVAANLRNMVTGVTEGFTKVLDIEGVGYRAEAQGQKLNLSMGFSHPVVMDVPAGLTATVEKSAITIAGFDKQAVGQFSAEVRAVRPPEPYKGKGIRYRGEHIIRKQGKKAV